MTQKFFNGMPGYRGLMIFLLLFFIGYLVAQEPPGAKALANDNSSVPVRLTREEQQQNMQRENASSSSCCTPPDTSPCCPTPCCPPPSMNCPPLQPYCDPCDCIIDYYNPLIFNGVDVSIEWLYWKVHQKACTFVLTPDGFHQPFPPAAANDGLGKYKYAHFDWNSGIRAALGYTFQRDAWHLLAQYTYYGTSGSNQAARPADLTLYLEATNKNINQTPEGLDLIKSRMRFSYQVANLWISRRFLPGCQILFDFFTGATGAWIRENWKISAFDLNNITTIIHNHWKFCGGGIRAGLETHWHLGGGVGLFSQFSAATLVGSFSNKKTVTLEPPSPPGDNFTNPLGHTREAETWVVPNTQIAFGIDWNHRFCSWAMSLTAAFEINTWYDLHQYHQSMQTTSAANSNHIDYRNASDVSLWGLNLNFAFSF